MAGENLASLYKKQNTSDKPGFSYSKAWAQETGFHISRRKVHNVTLH
jgi:hypothetical protein